MTSITGRTDVEMTGLVMIETHYLGPTEHRGARVVARIGDARTGSQRLTIDWDYELGVDANHAVAAAALANRLKSEGRWQRWPEDIRLVGGATREGYGFVLQHKGER